MNNICVVVVTYNRLEKLKNCLSALAVQKHSPKTVIVVDNASSDGTDVFLSAPPAYPFLLRYERLPENVGGAGGFTHGIKCFLQTDDEGVWLMDDDSLPTFDALLNLLAGEARAAALGIKADILASKVLWTNGELHPWNIPSPRYSKTRQCFDLIGQGLFPIRSASFLSILVRRESVERCGLPVADYFIYNDDIEYTGRILRQGIGLLVPNSVCVHDTTKESVRFKLPPERLRFEVRNKLWMIFCSPAWELRERLYYLLILGKNILNHCWPLRIFPSTFWAVCSGTIAAVRKKTKQVDAAGPQE